MQGRTLTAFFSPVPIHGCGFVFLDKASGDRLQRSCIYQYKKNEESVMSPTEAHSFLCHSEDETNTIPLFLPLLQKWLKTRDHRISIFIINVRFEAFTAVTMKNAVFWDVTPCGSCENRRFGGRGFLSP
jgi:hypothetical protein